MELNGPGPRRYVVYGQKGTGSVPVEATLLLLGERYDLVQPAPAEAPDAGGLGAEEMARVNPMRQVPALVLPSGELMTESAAMSVLDLYVTVVSAWGPRRSRFYQEAPKMAEVVRRVDQDPRLVDFWAERFS